MLPQDTRSPFEQLRLIEIYNAGATEIPAFGAVEIVDVQRPESASELTPGAGRVVVHVRRPTCDSSPRIMFNLFNPLGVGKWGAGTNEFPCWALCDTTTNNKRVGSVEDSYILGEGKVGFLVEGGSYAAGGGTATRIKKPDVDYALYKATLLEDMCVDDTEVDIDSIERISGCCDTETIAGTKIGVNLLPTAGCEGDTVIVTRYCVGDEEKFAIIAVSQKEVTVCTPSPSYGSCELAFPNFKIATAHCCPTPGVSTIPMYQHEVLRDAKIVKAGYSGGTGSGHGSGQQVCTLQLQTNTDLFCAFDPESTGALSNHYDPITFSGKHVVIDVLDDGDCIQKQMQWVYVLCWDDPETAEDVICREECP